MVEDQTQTEPEIDPATVQAASCPRCGYDLEGARAAWKESCPLSGICSECGYGFEWADVLRADRQRVRWLYEHAERWWDAWAAWRTILVALVPWRFWRRVRLHHDPRPTRLLSFAFVATLPLWMLATLIAVLGDLIAYGPAIWLSVLDGFFRFDAEPVRIWLLVGHPFVYPFWYMSAMAFCAAALCFASTWACASEWRQGRVRTAHIVRAGMYSLAPVIFLFAVSMFGMLLSSNFYGWLNWGSNPAAMWSRQESPFLAYSAWSSAALFLCYLLWLPLWWWTALKKGLELKRAWPLALLTVIWTIGGAMIPEIIGIYLGG